MYSCLQDIVAGGVLHCCVRICLTCFDVDVDKRLLPNHSDQSKAGADKPKQSTASYSSNNRDSVVIAVCDASFHWSHQCHLIKRFLEKYTEGEHCLSLEHNTLGSGENQRATC